MKVEIGSIIAQKYVAVVVGFLFHVNLTLGQQSSDIDRVMMSDEGAAYSLVSLSLKILPVKDSLLIISPYLFDNENLFPPLWDTVWYSQEKSYLVQQRYKYIGKLEVLEKTDSITIQRFLIYKIDGFHEHLVLNQGLQSIWIDENSSEGRFLGPIIR